MANYSNILVIDDDESIRWVLNKGLKKQGYSVDLAENGSEGLRKIKGQKDYFIVFLDIFMPDMSGLDLLKKAKKMKPELIVVIMTAQGTMKNTIEAMQRGAYDYITKPFDLEEIYLLVEKSLKEKEQRQKIGLMEAELKERFEVDELIGKSKKMREVFKLIGKAASSDVNILIRGESGVGKELVARALHYNSNRVAKPFVTINCAAIPKDLLESELFGHMKGAFTGALEHKKGKFELAEKGTLFLDEIGDMDLTLQAKILRVLQEKEFYLVGGKYPVKSEARIIAATNQNLEKDIENKQFREDLYHRLNVIAIKLPALNEHKEDIPLLANYFAQKEANKLNLDKLAISADALKLLKQHDWQGNVRELENTIKRAVILCYGNTIQPEHLPPNFMKYISSSDCSKTSSMEQFQNDIYNALDSVDDWNKGNIYNSAIQTIERALFKKFLVKTGWNQLKAANLLGINRNTLHKKIVELKIKKGP